MPERKMALTLAVLVALSTFAVAPAEAAKKKLQVPRASVEIPVGTVGDAPIAPEQRIDFSQLLFELDGSLYSYEELKGLGKQVSLAIDENALRAGVARATTTHEEFERYLDASCSNITAESNTAQCIFYDLSGCNWTVRVIVDCGLAVSNIDTLLTVRSFRLGCGTTFICGGGDCTACSGYTGAAGTCFNVTSGTVRCAGCAH